MLQKINLRDHLKLVAAAIDAAGHGQKGDVAQHHAVTLGMSLAALYRALKREVGWSSGRKCRSDKGASSVGDESLRFVAGLQRTSRRANGKLVLHATTALSVAVQHGHEIAVGPKQVQKLMRDRGLDAETQGRATPHVTMRSLHPNHVHMVDPSLCLLYYTPDGAQHIVREDVAYKNKPDAILKIKMKVWRYVLVDHYSHWICVYYFEARGETQDSLFHFLMHAWQQQEGRPFHGVPKALMMDPGSANTAHAIRNLCDAMDVALLINLPGQPRAKGSVEVAQNIVETQFESLLKFQPVENVAQLNAHAHNWCIGYNGNLIERLDSRLAREGMLMRMARTDIWLSSREVIRVCPETSVCAALMRGAARECQVRADLTIRYLHPKIGATVTYDVRNIRELRVKDRVIVRPLVYGSGAVIVEFELYAGEKRTWRIEQQREFDAVSGFPLDAPVIGEEYHALPVHDDQAAAAQLDQDAYGITADGVIRDANEIAAAKKDSKVKPFAHLNDGQGLKPLDALAGIRPPIYLPKKGVAVTPRIEPLKPLQSVALEKDGGALCVPTPATLDENAVRLTVLEMAKQLNDALGEDGKAERYARLESQFPTGVTYEEMPAVIEQFKRAAGLSGLRLVK